MIEVYVSDTTENDEWLRSLPGYAGEEEAVALAVALLRQERVQGKSLWDELVEILQKMPLHQVTPDSLKRESDRALTSLHWRIHQLWGQEGQDRELLEEKHGLIVDEMRRRGFKHESPLSRGEKGSAYSGHWEHTSQRRIGSEGGGSDLGSGTKLSRVLLEGPLYASTGEELVDMDPQLEEHVSKLLMPWEEDRFGRRSGAAQEIARRTGVAVGAVERSLQDWLGVSSGGREGNILWQRVAASMAGGRLSAYMKGRFELFPPGKVLGYETATPSVKQYRAMLSAMYDMTQERFRAGGYKPGALIRLYRGVKLSRKQVGDAGLYEGVTVPIVGNPLEGWSSNPWAALSFGATQDLAHFVGLVLSIDVPIERILSHQATGLGYREVREFVVLGGGEQDHARVVRIQGSRAIR